jgi:hypothetical protein
MACWYRSKMVLMLRLNQTNQHTRRSISQRIEAARGGQEEGGEMGEEEQALVHY